MPRSEEMTRRRVLLSHPCPPSLTADAHDYLGLFYLAAILEQAGWEPHVHHGSGAELAEWITEGRFADCAWIGFGCDQRNRSLVERLSRLVKKQQQTPVMVGGPETIALAEEFLQRSGCDVIVRGEAEQTIGAIAAALCTTTSGIAADRLATIPGLAFLDADGHLYCTPDNRPPQDLDALPFPAFHRSLHRERGYGGTIFTGRGCPFSCAFCCQNTGQRRVRLRSVESVVTELQRNFRQNPSLNYIIILDDTFTLNPRRVAQFCQALARLREQHPFVWYCEGHVGQLARHPEMLPEMAAAGLVRLQIGIESGSQAVLDAYNKPISPAMVEEVVTAAVIAGIPQIASNLIIGGPDETEAAFAETLAFAERLLRLAPGRLDLVTSFLRPYAGTSIGQNPERFGLVLYDMEDNNSMDDWPTVAPRGCTLEQMVERRQTLTNQILRTMRDLVNRNEVPLDVMRTQYRLAREHRMTSLWLTQTFRTNLYLDTAMRYLDGGEGRLLKEIPLDEQLDLRPLRTMEFAQYVRFDHGFPQIGNYVLAPLELALLKHASAKLKLAEIRDRLRPQFGGSDDDAEFTQRLVAIMAGLEARFFLVFPCV